MHIADEKLKEMIAYRHEIRGVEFKGPGSRSDKDFFSKVVRAVLALANKRDGGTVVVGLPDDYSGGPFKGLTDEQAETWNHDDVSDALYRYTDPAVDFVVSTHVVDGEKLVVIQVFEFREIPILCKKDYNKELRRGACYVRSFKKVESSEVPTQDEMRELLDIATEKGIRKFLKKLDLNFDTKINESEDDNKKFEMQLEDLK